MKRVFVIPLVAMVTVFWPAENVVRLTTYGDQAEARPGGNAGGFRAQPKRRPQGATTSPRPSRPATRPTRPAAGPGRPAQLPAAGNRPVRPPASRPPAARPPIARPPAARPPVARPPVARPPAARPPVARPPIANVPGRPPGARPPVRPPSARPPGWRPPNSRPPAWRPPVYRPPYVRPPDWRWGRYYWYPQWGWYHVAAIAGATLAYVATLPADGACEQLLYADETLYRCRGVLYRPTYYQDERVYEIVSPPEQQSANDVEAELRLTTPRLRGERVRALQNALVALGYDVGGVDGVFGPGTDNAVRAFQEDSGLPVDGVVDQETANALGEAFSKAFAPNDVIDDQSPDGTSDEDSPRQ